MSVSWIKLVRAVIIKLFLAIALGFVVFVTPAQAYTHEEPTSIFIPSAAIKLPVHTAQIAYNTWEVSETSASFGSGSALPGTLGNTVIFAHARQGLFGSLPQVKEGELIYVFTSHDWYVYKVTERLVVPPTQTDVIQQSEGAELTLFTCTGPKDSHRLVLKAELQS